MNAFEKLKYTSNATPGKSIKRPVSEDAEDVAKKKKYEKGRKERTFQESWKKNRDWLVYDSSTNTMKCTACCDAGPGRSSTNLKNSNKFVTGSSNFKLSTVTDHETGEMHIQAMAVWEASKRSSDQLHETQAGKAMQQLSAAQHHKLVYLFRYLHL